MARADIAIVGGGIAGGALATVLAREGLNVLLLERQAEYRDHVRGELLWPWGIAEARALGLEQGLLDAGANLATTLESHDEGRMEPNRDPVAGPDGVGGSLNLAHPTACRALAEAAGGAGATVLHDVADISVRLGDDPSVRYLHEGRVTETTARLVIGADGRGSSVRRQAGIPLEVDPPAHLVAGMLVDGIDGIDENVDLAAREGDLLFLCFPQGEGRARLYFCFPNGQRRRFAGPEASTRFLAACKLGCLRASERWSDSRPAGPCATFPASDARASTPVAEGVVLIGDAAGYENPLLGQGLAMALRDVREVTAAMAQSENWNVAAFARYAEARARRHHLAALATKISVWGNNSYNVQEPAERAARWTRVEKDELLTQLDDSTWVGYDRLPELVTERDVELRLEG